MTPLVPAADNEAPGARALRRETPFFFVPRALRRRVRPEVERLLLSFDRVRGLDGTGGRQFPDGSERVYFHHIQKTGGTSLMRSFMSLGGEDPTAVERRMAASFLTRATSNGLVFAASRATRATSNGLVFVAGCTVTLRHGNYFFGWSPIPSHALLLPERTFTVTVLRDPVARMVSYYRYLLANDPPHETWRGATDEERSIAAGGFAAFLEQIPREDLLRQLYMFSEGFDVNEAVDALRRCSFVLTTERYQVGLAELSARLALPLQARRDRVTAPTDGRIEERDLTRLRELLRLEYEMMARAGLAR